MRASYAPIRIVWDLIRTGDAGCCGRGSNRFTRFLPRAVSRLRRKAWEVGLRITGYPGYSGYPGYPRYGCARIRYSLGFSRRTMVPEVFAMRVDDVVVVPRKPTDPVAIPVEDILPLPETRPTRHVNRRGVERSWCPPYTIVQIGCIGG